MNIEKFLKNLFEKNIPNTFLYPSHSIQNFGQNCGNLLNILNKIVCFFTRVYIIKLH